MSLYNEIRPQSFNEVVGNEAVIKSLEKIVKQKPEKRPHAFLFSGPSGCGKTTLSRILAKEFGCSDIDFSELNVANTRGIDTIREVIDTANVYPMGGECRIFVFDEAHQLTRDAQNGLLKVIEDFPEKSYFIFCSTDPQKIIKTIQNRCSIFEVELLDEEELQILLEYALEKVEGKIPDKVFWGIVDKSEGSPRKVLTLLEKVLSVDKEENQLFLIEQDSELEKSVIDLCRLLLKTNNWAKISTTYKMINDKDPEKIRRAILGYMKSVLLSGQNDKVSDMIEIMSKHTFDSGEAGLVQMLYRSTQI